MFGAFGPSAPLLEVVTGPNGVPESKPLPVGRGGGASFWRAGFVGGVGAFAFASVPLVAELTLDAVAVTGFDDSVSISIGAGPVGAAV
jgi:hypothetical protein